jgi:hypothetical protein
LHLSSVRVAHRKAFEQKEEVIPYLGMRKEGIVCNISPFYGAKKALHFAGLFLYLSVS